jgi:hypothetical protein
MDSDPGRSPRKLTLAKRRELEVAAAVARDEVMQFHITSALRLIELAAGRVSASRMVAIHIRLHGISGALAELLSYSVLAALGQRSSNGAAASLVVEEEENAPKDARSLLRILRLRLRGRVHHDLRRAVELAMGAAQIGVLDIHVHHALRFARELADTHGIAQAVELYADMTDVPDISRQMLYAFVLDRLAADELPAFSGGNGGNGGNGAGAEGSPQRITSIARSKSRKAV